MRRRFFQMRGSTTSQIRRCARTRMRLKRPCDNVLAISRPPLRARIRRPSRRVAWLIWLRRRPCRTPRCSRTVVLLVWRKPARPRRRRLVEAVGRPRKLPPRGRWACSGSDECKRICGALRRRTGAVGQTRRNASGMTRTQARSSRRRLAAMAEMPLARLFPCSAMTATRRPC